MRYFNARILTSLPFRNRMLRQRGVCVYRFSQGFRTEHVAGTGFGDSPYQSVSSFAGNPYFIDLEQLIGDGLLSWQECESVWFGSDQEKVDYGAMYENRYPLLRKAYEKTA